MKFHSHLAIAALALAWVTFSSAFTAKSAHAEEDVAKAVAVPTDEKAPKKSSGTPIEKLNSSVRPLNVTADLNTSTAIGGTLVEVDVLLIKTAFGEASVPLSEIAGIRFPQGDDVSTTVVMLNGDSITGATDVKLVTIETDWGTAKINGSSIRSILFVPNLQWTSQPGISGKRWLLQDEKKEVAATGPTNSAGARPNSAPNIGVPSNGQPGSFQSNNNRNGFFNPQ